MYNKLQKILHIQNPKHHKTNLTNTTSTICGLSTYLIYGYIVKEVSNSDKSPFQIGLHRIYQERTYM